MGECGLFVSPFGNVQKRGGDRGNRGKLRAFRDRGSKEHAAARARSREREKEGDVMGWGLEWGTGTGLEDQVGKMLMRKATGRVRIDGFDPSAVPL